MLKSRRENVKLLLLAYLNTTTVFVEVKVMLGLHLLIYLFILFHNLGSKCPKCLFVFVEASVWLHFSM